MEESHPSTIAHYLMLAAGIPSPWRATQYRIDEMTKMVHVWITRHPLPAVEKRRGWFGKAAPALPADMPAAGPDMQWRHLNCMDYICHVHTQDVLDARHHELPWLGQPGQPFSNRLSRQVFACLMEGMEMSAICTMLNIQFADLWKFKFALDNGQIAFDYTPAKKSRAAAPAPAPSTPVQDANQVPDAVNPIWEKLIIGDLNIQIKTLSFQLLLTKLRQQVSLQQNNEVKLMKLLELHRYVERNARSLGYELHQLRAHSQSESA